MWPSDVDGISCLHGQSSFIPTLQLGHLCLLLSILSTSHVQVKNAAVGFNAVFDTLQIRTYISVSGTDAGNVYITPLLCCLYVSNKL